MTGSSPEPAGEGGRNIVVCADGTGKSFDGRVSNVVRLVELLDLDSPARQVVVYDAGIGSGGGPAAALDERRQDAVRRGALHPLPPPRVTRIPVLATIHRGAHQAVGLGLRRNVREMYLKLADLHAPGDAVFLFGYSRGAFTVRALAGLLHRCGLPPRGAGDEAARFARAWDLYTPMRPPEQAAAFRATQRPCPVRFVGLWDTVKSYGGLVARRLPHLRHNPDVVSVRHALALDERRAFFAHTTWGRLESDKRFAMTRLPREHLDGIAGQDVREVWFAGCHSDVGGDHPVDAPPEPEPGDPAAVTLRWMVAEAVNVAPRLLLGHGGDRLLARADPPPDVLRIGQSWTGVLRRLEVLPRLQIDNGGYWPALELRAGSDGPRAVDRSVRDGELSDDGGGRVYVHETAAGRVTDLGDVRVEAVRTLGAPGRDAPPGPASSGPGRGAGS